MSSSRSERVGRRGALRMALAVAALLAGAVAPAGAGFAVRVEYLDPSGRTVVAEGDDAAYVFYRRVLYREPRGEEKRTYRDDAVDVRKFPFLSRKVKFAEIREVRFERRDEEGREVLILAFEMTTGRRFEMRGADLEGAGHPTSPLVQFREGDRLVQIPIDPVTPAARRAGAPCLVRMEFPNNPDRRRPERPPRKPKESAP